jgi:diguanylate cyclase (GGDEF)-like protein
MNNDPNDPALHLSRAQRDLSILYELSNAMRTTLELDQILYIILTGVTSHIGLGFNRAILFLHNPKDRTLDPKMAVGPESAEHAKRIWEYLSSAKHQIEDITSEYQSSEHVKQSSLFESIKNLKIPLVLNNGSILGKAFHEGSPLHLKEKDLEHHAGDPLFQFFKTTELVIMPLKAKDKVKGLIIADNLFTKKPITEDDLRIFMMLANQAGLAIENSQLYELARHKSHTDPVTNIWNHGFFQSQLLEEISKANKDKTNLCLIILDIDNFKKLNDQFGHQTGDLILKELAEVLNDSSRETDFVCRYGGEEFALILPCTNQEQCVAMAERIRKNIDEHSFSATDSNKPVHVTVSVGLAIYPKNARTKEDFIGKADKAMYMAKFGGKNQVVIAEI